MRRHTTELYRFMWIRSTPTTMVTKRYIQIMSSFISCTIHVVLLGWRCQRDMWHAREKCDIYTTTARKISVLLKELNKTTKKNPQSTFPNVTQPSYRWQQLTGQRATFPLRSRPTITRNLAVKPLTVCSTLTSCTVRSGSDAFWNA